MADEKNDAIKVGSQEHMQAHYDHIAARGETAREKPAKDRTEDDWKDIAEHRKTFGMPDPDWQKDYDELDKRTKPKKKGSVLHDHPRSSKKDD